jgi:hypothetical protein
MLRVREMNGLIYWTFANDDEDDDDWILVNTCCEGVKHEFISELK